VRKSHHNVSRAEVDSYQFFYIYIEKSAYYAKVKVKISLLQAMEAHRVARG
jgi:hypothetical protein